jgi:integrase
MNTQIATTDRVNPLALIQGAELADSTKVKYTRIVGEYLSTGRDLLDAGALGDFARGLSNSRRSHLRAAVKIYTDRLRDLMNATADPMGENAVEQAARMELADRRYESLVKAIQVKQPKGKKTHTWLSQAQVRAMYQATGAGIEGERDRVALGLLVAAGLRREEAVTLTFDDIKLQPFKDKKGEAKMRTVLAVTGKGAKDRPVPISDHLANLIDTWGRRVGATGPIIRSLGRNREPGESMSAVALFKLVRRYGRAIGKPDLAAHDLRRTFAQQGLEAGIPLTQISILLGHSSLDTTRKYLNLQLDIESTISDFISWG